ncbi:cytochrome P450, partial [Streptomyces sp. SID10244]|nr:cytochrome P450 [Streptomyces sp. SID10244]
EESRTQVRVWTDELLQREVGQMEMSEVGFNAVVELARFYYGLSADRRKNPQDDMITKLTQAAIERDDDEPPTLSNMEIS